MFVVVLTKAPTDLAGVAQLLANELGGIAYEHRMKLARGVPTVLLRSAEEGVARRLQSALGVRGEQGVVLDTATLVKQGQMVRVRGFRFDEDALRRTTVDGSQDESNDPALYYTDLSTIVRVVTETSTQTTTTTKERKFSATRAALSGGFVMTKTQEVEHTQRHHGAEQLLYLFPGSGTPWLLREHGTNYKGLGADLEPSSFRNVLSFVATLRSRAPGAVYDESLMGPPGAAARTKMDELDVLATAIFRGTRLGEKSP